MQEESVEVCEVCCLQVGLKQLIKLKCQHAFCCDCLKDYIRALKAYRRLTPDKLQCFHEGCSEQIGDEVLMSLFPGEEGFVLKTIRKCYKESTNPSNVIFSCVGIMKNDRKPLIEKPQRMDRGEHSKITNQLVRDMQQGRTTVSDVKTCNNIHIYHKTSLCKEKSLQCYLCGCSYCLSCFQLEHQGTCPIKEESPLLSLKKVPSEQHFQSYISANQILRCLNPKCAIPIDKQQGCFWVKCRCSWEMCYPCGKLWGDCQHFSRYPYQKFTPPADWLVKALQLY